MFERKRLVDSIAVLIDVIDLCIEPWIMALAATQILPMRRRGLFLALELIGTLLWAFVFGTVLSWFWTGLVVCGILEFVLPLLFWRGSPFRKVSALFVIQLCSIVAGAVVWTCWEAIFGMPIPEDSTAEFALYRSDLGKWLIYEILDMGLSAILLIPAVVLFRRWAWRTADTRGSVVFAGLLVAQLLMASVPMICMARSLGTGAYAVIALILLVYLVVGIGAIVASWHWEVAARAQRRSEELGSPARCLPRGVRERSGPGEGCCPFAARSSKRDGGGPRAAGEGARPKRLAGFFALWRNEFRRRRCQREVRCDGVDG